MRGLLWKSLTNSSVSWKKEDGGATETENTTKRETRGYAKTYLADGTVFKGTIRSKGNLEAAGDFTGDIFCESDVLVSSDINSNITAVNLIINASQITGDVKAEGIVNISDGSVIVGDVEAHDVICNGRVDGNLKVIGHISLGDNAVINGGIVTGTISMVRGSVFHGTVEMTENSWFFEPDKSNLFWIALIFLYKSCNLTKRVLK